MGKGWFGLGGDDDPDNSNGSLSSHDGEFQFSNHERRSLTVNFEHQNEGSFSDEWSEPMEDDYGTMPSPDKNHERRRSRRHPPLTANNNNNNNNSNSSIMDLSSSSILSINSTASLSQSIREKLQDLRQYSRESITQSMRQMQQAIAEHTGSIGMLGSLSIAINNLTGPAMLSLPATFVRSGIIPTACTLIFVSILSALCSLHMANVISKVPQNQDFKQGVEFPEAFRTFWGKEWFILANWLFFACITVLNISSLVDNAQVLDTFLGHCNPFGGAWGLAINPNHWNASITSWDPSVCSEQQLYEGGCVPFASIVKEHDNQVFLVTGGYVATALLFFPLALMDLTENVQWQILGFLILCVVSVQFIFTFAMSEWDGSNLTWWGESYDSLLGVVLFNFALVITVPAWLYEKEPHVDIPTVMHTSTIISTLLYLLVGILGCLAMPDVSDNFLESIMSGALGPAMQIGASVFAFFIIGMNIPLFSILIRLCLMGGGNELRAAYQGNQLCSRRVANVLAVYLPFGLSWIMYQGSKVTLLLSWGGMIFTSLVAFLLPLALAQYVVKTKHESFKGSVQVYPWGFADMLSSKQSQIRALKILLLVSTLAIAVALGGNIAAANKSKG